MTSDPVPSFTRTVLQRTPAPTAGFEIVQARTEIPAGVMSGRHDHPGPEIGYVVSGELSMEYDDGTALAVAPGGVFLNPRGIVHNARSVGTDTLVMVSTYVIDEGQPLTTMR